MIILTGNHLKVLRYARQFYEDNGRYPYYREVAEGVGLHTSSIGRLVREMLAEGLLDEGKFQHTRENSRISTTSVRVLDFVIDFKKTHGYAPTNREINDAIGLSLSTVHHHLFLLRRAGYISYLDNKNRTITVLKEFDL